MLFELLAFWGGGTTATELAKVLECGRRETGQARIQAFAREFPETIRYDRHSHRVSYLGDADSLRLCPSDADQLLSWLIGEQIAATSSGQETPFAVEVIDVSSLVPHPVPPETLRAVILGIIRKRTLSVIYQSKKQILALRFSPHTVIWASGRHHVRGHAIFSGEEHYFVDLVLARILETRLGDAGDYVMPEQDEDWQRGRDLTFELTADLEASERDAVRRDHGLLDNQDTLIVRGVRDALASYVVREVTGRRIEGHMGPVWSFRDEIAAQAIY
jgi:hypothetical protein